MSQVELAARCRLGRAQVCKYEAGKELMKLGTLAKILDALAIESSQFFVLAASLETSLEPVPQISRGTSDRKLEEAFARLHETIDEIHKIVKVPQSQATGSHPGHACAAGHAEPLSSAAPQAVPAA